MGVFLLSPAYGESSSYEFIAVPVQQCFLSDGACRSSAKRLAQTSGLKMTLPDAGPGELKIFDVNHVQSTNYN